MQQAFMAYRLCSADVERMLTFGQVACNCNRRPASAAFRPWPSINHARASCDAPARERASAGVKKRWLDLAVAKAHGPAGSRRGGLPAGFRSKAYSWLAA